MSSAIQFVHRADIGPSLLGLLFWDGVKGVQVSIVPLGGGDYLDQVVEVLAYLRVGIDLEGVRSALHNFVHVGIIEVDSFVLALLEAGCLFEVSNAAGFLTFLESIGDSNGVVGLEAGCPEIVIDLYLAERHG